MRRIAIINQKGGVGKTTTTANLGAALAIQGRRVVVVDMDAQANLSLSLGVEAPSGTPTAYTVLTGTTKFGAAIRPTTVPRLSIVPANLDLSGAELELAAAMGREFILRDAIREWVESERAKTGRAPADYVLFDCPPSLGLLSINALATAGEVLITLQTEFLALQGMSKLVGVVQLLKKRLNPELVVTGIVPCLYDSRLRLAREVLGEIRTYFKGQVFPHPVRANVKLAEAPSFGQTVFEYAPDSNGADDYMRVAREVTAREGRDPELAGLPAFDEKARLPLAEPIVPRVPPRPPPRRAKSESANVAAAEERAAANANDVATTAHDASERATTPETVASSSLRAKPVSAKFATTDAPKSEAPVRAESKKRPDPAANGAREKDVARTAIESSRASSADVRASVANEKALEPAVTTPRANAPKSASAPLNTTRESAPTPREPSSAARESSRGNEARSPDARSATRADDDRVITPAPRAASRPEPRVLRAEDVPPLPPDAFEILSILPTDP